MKALTLPQPYASLVAAGIIGGVPRREPTAYRGLLAIHAEAYYGVLRPTSVDHLLHRLGPRELPRGEILAVAELVGVTEPAGDGVFWHSFANVRRLRVSVSSAGATRVWTVPPSVAELVRRQVR
jgi:hypothetical protein